MAKIFRIVLLLSFLTSGSVWAQSIRNTTCEEVYEYVDDMPTYPGGLDNFIKYLAHSLPKKSGCHDAIMQHQITFVVDQAGKIEDVKLNGFEEACEKEIRKALYKSPSWRPGQKNGEKVCVRYRLQGVL